MSQETAIVIFKEKEIRRAWHNEQWWFAIIDVVSVLTDSANQELNKGWGQIATPLPVATICHCYG